VLENLKNIARALRSAFRKRSIPLALSLIVVVLVSVGSGIYAGASFFSPLANVTVTSTTFVTTTSWITSTVMSTVTQTVQGVLTTIVYTSSTSTTTYTGPDGYTKLLLHMDGSQASQTFTDSSPQAYTVTSNGGASIDTSRSEFGGASGKFVANSHQYLSTPDSTDWAFGTADFTIDFWIRFNSLPGVGSAHTFWGQFQNLNNYIWLRFGNDGAQYLQFYVQSGGSNTIAAYCRPTISTNTWYHFAVVRSGSNFYMFVNGISQSMNGGSNSNAVPDIVSSAYIGQINGGYYFDGWLDEFRVSNGIARWTSNFTPPTAPY
jgi:hypothetical protein